MSISKIIVKVESNSNSNTDDRVKQSQENRLILFSNQNITEMRDMYIYIDTASRYIIYRVYDHHIIKTNLRGQ